MDEKRFMPDSSKRDFMSFTRDELPIASAARPEYDITYIPKEENSSNSKVLEDDTIPSGGRHDLPPGTSLAAIFRYHMGIENDPALVPEHLAQRKAIDPIATGTHKGRRAVNLGIYNRAIREERGTAIQYRTWSIVINAALGLQIIFATLLTALGAVRGPSDVVALFGALNTIIAGFLTYLKGTGLPMRMKYFHNQWLKLRAYIEQRERDFASDDQTGAHRYGYRELMEEVHVIEAMYQNIRKDVERHTPDNFGGSKGEDTTNAPGEGAPPASLASKGLQAFRTRLGAAAGAAHTQGGVESRVKNTVNDIEQGLSTHLHDRLAKLEEMLHSRVHGDESVKVAGLKEKTTETESQDIADKKMTRISEKEPWS